MSNDDRQAYFRRKPKEILVLDCVYHENGHKEFAAKSKDLERKIAEMERRESALLAKISGLSASVSQLLEASKILNTVAGIK